MRIASINKTSIDELSNSCVDAVVAATGYESRARAFAKIAAELYAGKGTAKCVLGFIEHEDNIVRRRNDDVFRSLGYQFSVIPGDDSRQPQEWILALFERCQDRDLHVVVDVSSMTRNWYGGIIKALSLAKRNRAVVSTFVYTPAKWSPEPTETLPNDVVGPVPGYSGHVLPSKPPALLIGLGKEEGRALGLKDYLDPKMLVCFHAKPGAETRYERSAMRANQDLLQTVPDEQVYAFDLFDPLGSFRTLEAVCQGLQRDYRVVLASLGPKVFGLYCFLIHTKMPEVSVWRVSPATRRPPFDHKPMPTQVMLDVVWE